MNTPHVEGCPDINCNNNKDCCPFRKIVISAVMGDDSEGSPSAPDNGRGKGYGGFLLQKIMMLYEEYKGD